MPTFMTNFDQLKPVSVRQAMRVAGEMAFPVALASWSLTQLLVGTMEMRVIALLVMTALSGAVAAGSLLDDEKGRAWME